MKELQEIYGKLGDDASRFIFEKRLLYSVSKDLKFLEEMVSGEMDRYGNCDAMNKLMKWLEDWEGKIYVFGAGFSGQEIVKTLKRCGIQVEHILDNNQSVWGQLREKIEVVSPDILNRLKRDTFRVIVGANVCTGYADEIFHQLVQMGIDQKDIYYAGTDWWLGDEPQYFDREIMIPCEHEVFIDGGSLDGGDSRHFMEWCGGSYDRIYAFEPDEENYKKVEKLSTMYKNLVPCMEGLWSKTTELSFSSGIRENSRISGSGSSKVKVVSIDEKLDGKPATFIKMDIEGSEMEALCGAEQTIRKYQPKLAICVYHKPEDIIDIPKKILEMNPAYKLYLRHYSYLHTETVLYAVME
jgi:FkbM family methyltransferase